MKPTNASKNQSVIKKENNLKNKYRSKNITNLNKNSTPERKDKNSPKLTAKLITNDSPNIFIDSDLKFKQSISLNNVESKNDNSTT